MLVSQTVKQEEPIFSFKQQHPDCYYIGVTHSFPSDTPTSPTLTPTSALPSFNHDNTHFTPSFILTIDRDYYRLNIQFERQKFHEKLLQAEAQLSKEAIFVIDPSPRFCQICRRPFENYSQHIREKAHGKALMQTQGNKWILETCAAMGKKEKLIKKEEKGRASKTQPRGMTRVKKKDTSFCNDVSLLSRTSNPSNLTL